MFVCTAVIVFSCTTTRQYRVSQTINPLQYGLNDAKTGEERYYVLLRTHEEAQRLGVGVSYEGIKNIDLTIPAKVKPIPLSHYTDFAGVTIRVENKQKNLFLFQLTSPLIPVFVTGEEIDGGDFSKNKDLKQGVKLLIINDSTLWVQRRAGHVYGATRKDIMLINNGESANGPVMSYCTSSSTPQGFYRDIAYPKKTVFKNITFERTITSTAKTYLIKVENQYDVELSGITINTPDGSGMYGDRSIFIVNSYKTAVRDVTIQGTYSLDSKSKGQKRFGYGISLDNTYDFYVCNLYARANWGVFGNNNVHKAVLEKCDINRFDIHCYGKDISFIDCNFVSLYNQLSSVYGLISFVNCTFNIGFRPLLNNYSYNAYVGYDVSFERCTFNMGGNNNSIIGLSGFCKEENSRPELKEKCLPNVTMVDCIVNVSKDVKKWYVFNIEKIEGYNGRFGYLSCVNINGLSVSDKTVEMELFNGKIKTKNKVSVKYN